MALKKRSKRHIFRAFGIGLLLSVIMLALYITQPAYLQDSNRKIYDALLHLHTGGTPSPTPAIIDIDEKSLTELGQWPWPRYHLAQLLTILTENGAASVGLDILLSEADRTSPVLFKERLSNDLGLTISFSGIPETLEDNDATLASILSQTPSVLGFYLRFNTPPQKELIYPKAPGLIEQVSSGGISPLSYIMKATYASLPLPEFVNAAPVGAINVATPADGIIRVVPLVTQLGNRVYPNLSLRSLMQGLKVKTLRLHGGADGLNAVQVGSHIIPVSPQGEFSILFRGAKGQYPTFSFVDVLQGKISQEEIQGRIFFVGSSAAGLLDIRTTPFDAYYPGVEVHAATIDAILSKRFLTTLPWEPGAQAISILLVGLLCAATFSFTRPAVYILLAIGLLTGTLAGSIQFFRQGFFFSPLYILLTIALSGVVMLCLRFWQEERQKRVLHGAFGRYVAPEIVDSIMESGENIFAGEKREVTILFTDIRSFTALSEKLSPEQVVGLLNRYFTPMTSLVRTAKGTLDKFIGDALLAFWNAPVEVPGHPQKAVETALRMHEELAILNANLQKELDLTLHMGAGLHTGSVYVGNMGSQELLDYTIIGDNVNLASRIEGLTGFFGIEVVASGVVKQYCDNSISFIPLDYVQLKGKSASIDVYWVLRAPEAEKRKTELEQFQKALEAYRAGDFTTAHSLFKVLSTNFSTTVYSIYLERCEILIETPPTEWAGVWAYKAK